MALKEPETENALRRVLNGHPMLALGIVVILVAAAVLFWKRSQPPHGVPTGFYTVDDGVTFFPYAASALPPMMIDGKEAVLAKVFSCDQGKTQFVGYLMRYTDEGRKVAEEMLRKQIVSPNSGYQVKKPGAGNPWVNAPSAGPMMMRGPGAGADTAKFTEVTRISCPDGKPAMGITPMQ